VVGWKAPVEGEVVDVEVVGVVDVVTAVAVVVAVSVAAGGFTEN
jgi:hypothetical protein